jgi:hypothetical protein
VHDKRIRPSTYFLCLKLRMAGTDTEWVFIRRSSPSICMMIKIGRAKVWWIYHSHNSSLQFATKICGSTLYRTESVDRYSSGDPPTGSICMTTTFRWAKVWCITNQSVYVVSSIYNNRRLTAQHCTSIEWINWYLSRDPPHLAEQRFGTFTNQAVVHCRW